MRKLIITILALAPLAMWAQDNTWERPEEEEQEEVAEQKVNPNAKYLRGAVPEVDGKVVFSKHIDAPGKSAADIYAIVKGYMEKMLKEKNQLETSKLIDADAGTHTVTAFYEEWLVFKKSAIVLDRTRFYYAMKAECKDGAADITISHIRYLYEEERNPQRLTAENWITDKEAVNKKNTKLYPGSGKFRRKTIDRKDFLFNKIESLLK
jgi:colicin import membrane protein